MHDGCSGAFATGEQIVSKIRMMGFNKNPIGVPYDVTCVNCSHIFKMTHMETGCPECDMVYGVTPCHSQSADCVKPAGINY